MKGGGRRRLTLHQIRLLGSFFQTLAEVIDGLFALELGLGGLEGSACVVEEWRVSCGSVRVWVPWLLFCLLLYALVPGSWWFWQEVVYIR